MPFADGPGDPEPPNMRVVRSVDTVGAALATAVGLIGGCGGSVELARGGAPDGGTENVPKMPAPLGPASDAGVGSPTGQHPCVNPTPFLLGGKDTGYETCQGGTRRRRALVGCPSLLLRPSNRACVY